MTVSSILQVLLTHVPCQSCLCHSCAAYRHPHGFSPVPHSQPTLAALWTKLNTELKPTPLSHHMAYIPDPTEKLQVSCSHTMPAPLSKSNPNNAHPPLISTYEPKEEINRPHINLGHSKPQEGHIYACVKKKGNYKYTHKQRWRQN